MAINYFPKRNKLVDSYSGPFAHIYNMEEEVIFLILNSQPRMFANNGIHFIHYKTQNHWGYSPTETTPFKEKYDKCFIHTFVFISSLHFH